MSDHVEKGVICRTMEVEKGRVFPTEPLHIP